MLGSQNKACRPVVVEGPDGSGKSFLAEYMAAHHGFHLLHTGGPIKDLEDAWHRLWGVKTEVLRRPRLVLDRHPSISEVVYSRIRGLDAPTLPEKYVKIFKNIDPVLVWCFPPPSSLHPDWIESQAGKAHKSEAHIQLVYEQRVKVRDTYAEVMKSYYDAGVDVVEYRYWEHPRTITTNRAGPEPALSEFINASLIKEVV